MALIRNFEQSTKDRHTVHKSIGCAYSIFIGSDNKKYLQLDTFGTEEREIPGKVSQCLQFDEVAAAELKRLIERSFPNL